MKFENILIKRQAEMPAHKKTKIIMETLSVKKRNNEKNQIVTRNGNGSLRSRFPSFLDDFFSGEIFNWNLDNELSFVRNHNSVFPSVNIKENSDSYDVELAAPGLGKDNFSVEITDNNELVLSSKSETSDGDEHDGYTRREFSYSSFQRSFKLPDGVDKDKVSAKYTDGILKVSIPRLSEAIRKPNKQIEIHI
jgi:HSP20 family protein